MWLIGNNKKTLDSNPIQDDDCYARIMFQFVLWKTPKSHFHLLIKGLIDSKGLKKLIEMLKIATLLAMLFGSPTV